MADSNFVTFSEHDSKVAWSDLLSRTVEANDRMMRMAGWKGISKPYSYNAEGVLFFDADTVAHEVALSVVDNGRKASLAVFSIGDECRVEGRLLDEDLCRKYGVNASSFDTAKESVLSFDNVQNLQGRTCGCAEIIPVILDNRGIEPHPIFFYPESRWDVEKALMKKYPVGARLDPSQFNDAYKAIQEESTGETLDTRGVTLDKYALLFDGKNFHSLGRGEYLAGKLAFADRSLRDDVMTRLTIEADKLRGNLQMTVLNGERVNAQIAPSHAIYPSTSSKFEDGRSFDGNHTVKLVSEGKPFRFVYIDNSGRINVTDGQGVIEMPFRACFHDRDLEDKLNSTDFRQIQKGVSEFVSYMHGICMEQSNIEKYKADVDEFISRNLDLGNTVQQRV